MIEEKTLIGKESEGPGLAINQQKETHRGQEMMRGGKEVNGETHLILTRIRKLLKVIFKIGLRMQTQHLALTQLLAQPVWIALKSGRSCTSHRMESTTSDF